MIKNIILPVDDEGSFCINMTRLLQNRDDKVTAV